MSALDAFRDRLDRIDEIVVELLGERFEICRAVALYKHRHGIAMLQPARVEAVRAGYIRRGRQADLPADFTAALFELLIEATCRVEDELMAGLSVDAGP